MLLSSEAYSTSCWLIRVKLFLRLARLPSLGRGGVRTDGGDTREGEAFIAYDARSLIDRAAREGYQVLSITNHDTLTFSAELAAYAWDRGVLLIPGVEATIEGRHLLVYNLDVPPASIRTFADLRRRRTPEWLVVAAHPFFPAPVCLGHTLLEQIDLFDAIEFSHFYTPRIDFNRPAVELARKVGLPLLGTSDSHLAEQFGTTYSLIEGGLTVACFLSAVRAGKLTVVSRPLTLAQWGAIGLRLALSGYRERAARWRSGASSAHNDVRATKQIEQIIS